MVRHILEQVLVQSLQGEDIYFYNYKNDDDTTYYDFSSDLINAHNSNTLTSPPKRAWTDTLTFAEPKFLYIVFWFVLFNGDIFNDQCQPIAD